MVLVANIRTLRRLLAQSLTKERPETPGPKLTQRASPRQRQRPKARKAVMVAINLFAKRGSAMAPANLVASANSLMNDMRRGCGKPRPQPALWQRRPSAGMTARPSGFSTLEPATTSVRLIKLVPPPKARLFVLRRPTGSSRRSPARRWGSMSWTRMPIALLWIVRFVPSRSVDVAQSTATGVLGNLGGPFPG